MVKRQVPITKYVRAAALGATLGAQKIIKREAPSGSVRRGLVKRKRATGGTVYRKRKRVVDTRSSDLTYVQAKSGRLLPRTLKGAWRFLNGNMERTVFAHRVMSQFGGVNGAVDLPNKQAAAGAQVFAPCHAYELTSVCNSIRDVSGNSILSNGTVYRFLSFTNETATGTSFWTNSADWQQETQSVNPSNSGAVPNAASMLKWINARFMFYAPTQNPTKISIEVIQFSDERLVPGASYATTDAPFVTAFWQYMTKKYMYNPIEPLNTRYRRYVKVLKSISFIMDPKESTEPNSTRYKEINLFMRFNRMMRYDWEHSDRVNMQITDGQVNTQQNKTQAHPLKSLFLIVRGLAVKATAYNAALHPSYDICLRTCHEQLSA